jgi:hypothetical protein
VIRSNGPTVTFYWRKGAFGPCVFFVRLNAALMVAVRPVVFRTPLVKRTRNPWFALPVTRPCVLVRLVYRYKKCRRWYDVQRCTVRAIVAQTQRTTKSAGEDLPRFFNLRAHGLRSCPANYFALLERALPIENRFYVVAKFRRNRLIVRGRKRR